MHRLFSQLSIPVTVVNGAHAGPVMFATAAVHGDELDEVRIEREGVEGRPDGGLGRPEDRLAVLAGFASRLAEVVAHAPLLGALSLSTPESNVPLALQSCQAVTR